MKYVVSQRVETGYRIYNTRRDIPLYGIQSGF
jgi:hypothetical protein